MRRLRILVNLKSLDEDASRHPLAAPPEIVSKSTEGLLHVAMIDKYCSNLHYFYHYFSLSVLLYELIDMHYDSLIKENKVLLPRARQCRDLMTT